MCDNHNIVDHSGKKFCLDCRRSAILSKPKDKEVHIKVINKCDNCGSSNINTNIVINWQCNQCNFSSSKQDFIKNCGSCGNTNLVKKKSQSPVCNHSDCYKMVKYCQHCNKFVDRALCRISSGWAYCKYFGSLSKSTNLVI